MQQQGSTSLRAQLSAAPLKLYSASVSVSVSVSSPRSIERGPIEAGRFVWRLPAYPSTLRAQLSAAPLKPQSRVPDVRLVGYSPRSIERGPIEAMLLPALHGVAHVSPRSIERGPIEASTTPSVARSTAGSLRAQLSAAPLKPAPGLTTNHRYHSLRAQLSAAPLKLS